MVNLLEAIFLGFIQGISEWLPISSSGHLVIAQEILDIRVPLFFDILLHLGTLVVIVIFFSKDIMQILGVISKLDFHSEYGRLVLFIILGNIPTAIIGFVFYDILAAFFSNLFVVGSALLITGIILYSTRFSNPNRKLNYIDSIIIGLAQGIALVPGISRSGFTIGTGLLRRIRREEVFRYSFLMAIPAIIGAMVFDIQNLPSYEIEIAPMIAGFIIAIIVGYVSLKLILRILTKGKFHYFSYYCWIMGVLLIIITISS